MRLEHDLVRLPHGLTLALAPLPYVESVSMGLWVRAGGRHEPAALSGAGHFIEHLVFKGTPARSARAISRAIEGRGGHVNAFTQEDSTCFYAHVAAERAPEVFDILCDIFLHARLAERDVAGEKPVILEEIASYRDQPAHRVHEILDELLWARHPLGRNLAGSEATVGRLTAGALRRYKDRVYVPANTIVTLAGRLDGEDWTARVRRAFARRAPGRRTAFRPVLASTPQRALDASARPIEQTHLAMGFRCFGRRDPRRHALRVLSIVLGETLSSRLFHLIREQRGLAYSIQSEVQLFDDTGVFAIDAGLDADRDRQALALIFEQLRRIRDRPVSPQELKLAKDYAAGQLKIGLETSSSRMMWLGEHLAAYDRVVQPDEILDGLRAVTADDLRALARRLFVPRRLSVALIAPDAAERRAAELRTLMERL